MATEKPAAAAAEKSAGGNGKSEAPRKPAIKLALAAILVLVLEGATIGVTMMISSGPRRVIADVPATLPAAAVERDAEVKLIVDKLPNSQGGSRYLYDLQVFVKVAEKNKGKVTDLFAEREAEIKDHIRIIIASSDSQALSEPGLETLRRQIAYQLEQDIGKDLVKEVLIPKCTPIKFEF